MTVKMPGFFAKEAQNDNPFIRMSPLSECHSFCPKNSPLVILRNEAACFFPISFQLFILKKRLFPLIELV